MSNSRIKELIKNISKANDDYYNKNDPTVSDQIYDAWKDELTQLVENCTDKKLAKQANDLINRVGADVEVTHWEKVSHPYVMTSLNKINTPSDLYDWLKSCDIICPKELFLVEKLDGISVDLQFENGKLVQAATRGNGKVGEKITPNVQRMKGVPKKLKKNFTGHIRGEIILKKSDHKKYFSDYPNTRNAASGTAKRYDGEKCEHLTVLCYQVPVSDIEFKTELKQFKFIRSLGLETPHYNVYSDPKTLIDEYIRYENEAREKLDYEIDGLVVRVNYLSEQYELGEKNHRPKGAVAFKFEAEARETTLKDIVWQVGNTGRITPLATFDEIHLVGANIERASLYNYSYIKQLKLDVGAKIIVARANDVIPFVKEASKKTGTIAKHPNKCPECNAATKFEGEYLICTNKTSCPAQKMGKLKMWIKENNILEWSTATLQKVIDAELVDDIADLYRLQPEQIVKLERMGEKSAQNLVDVLDKHRDILLENFIGGLGIEGVATTTTKLLISAGYDSLERLQSMTISQIEAIDGFGLIRAEAFYYGLRENKERIEDILDAGVVIKKPKKGKLSGSSVCFTGAMSQPRAKLQGLVKAHGGTVKSSVSKGLDFLVIDDINSKSNKASKAKKLGTKLISEGEFLDMVS